MTEQEKALEKARTWLSDYLILGRCLDEFVWHKGTVGCRFSDALTDLILSVERATAKRCYEICDEFLYDGKRDVVNAREQIECEFELDERKGGGGR